jgi:hypothetical protein
MAQGQRVGHVEERRRTPEPLGAEVGLITVAGIDGDRLTIVLQAILSSPQA